MTAYKICIYLWIAWFAIWLIWALQSKKTKQQESLASRFTYTLTVWASMYVMFNGRDLGFLQSDIFPRSPLPGWFGIAITLFGFAITLWARYILGSNWSGTVTIKVDHELIRTGPYRYVRHPIYTGMIVALVGTAVARGQWRGLPAIILLWLGFTIKRLKEEQFMRQTFGEQYTQYSRTTGAIFPHPLRRAS